MGFIGGLPKSKGAKTLYVVVNCLTKIVHFIALAHPYSAKDVASVLSEKLSVYMGFPAQLFLTVTASF